MAGLNAAASPPALSRCSCLYRHCMLVASALETATGDAHAVFARNSHDMLTVNEIFFSIQGESTFAGLPCVFVRLTACDLRCTWCDTAYAFSEGQKRSV